MPNSVRAIRLSIFAYLTLWPLLSYADNYSARIRHADLIDNGDNFSIETQIDYQLSPTAKEALHKGVPLTWNVLVELREVGRIWDSTIYSEKLPYRLQFHALLNQYDVVTSRQESEMFQTLNAALSFMSNLQDVKPIDAKLFQPGHRYKLAIKCQFDRESLPVPLRPSAYLNTQWYLSSDWYIWPIQN